MKPARPAPMIWTELELAAFVPLVEAPDPVGEPEAFVDWAPVPVGDAPAEAVLPPELDSLAPAEEGEPGAKGAMVWVLGKRLAKQSCWHFAYASVSSLEPEP